MKIQDDFNMLRDFMYHFIPLVLLTIVVVIVGLSTHKYLFVERIKGRERNVVEQGRRTIQAELALHAKDALLVVEVFQTIYRFCPDSSLTRSMTKGVLEGLSNIRQDYAQISFLDISGGEIARVDRQMYCLKKFDGRYNQQDRIVHTNFDNVVRARAGQVIISSFDLNIEYGKVGHPLGPRIRFATPIDDLSGKRLGFVELVYCGRKFIEMIKQYITSDRAETYLINNDGYWLTDFSTDLERGFMLGSETSGYLRQQFPEFWAYIGERQEGQVVLGDHLFSFVRMSPLPDFLYPLKRSPQIKKPEQWMLFSRVPLPGLTQNIIVLDLAIGALVLLILAVISWLWTKSRFQEHEAKARLVYSATRDGLTGLYNRRAFVSNVDQEIERAKRYRRALSFLLFDIDHFKKINDRYGHDGGDEVLRALAKHMKVTCREQDVSSRVGGEEFAVLLPETDSQQAIIIAERLRQSVAELSIKLRGTDPVHFTISIGVTSLDGASCPSDVTFHQMYTKADALMYQAKEQGRNRVVVG